MLPESDSRIAAFQQFVEEAGRLWHEFDRAFDDEIQAAEAMRIIENPGKRDNVSYLEEFLAKLGDIRVLRGRHAAARVRFQLHLTKGRATKKAALETVRELILDAVEGEASLTTCPIGPFAQHYLDEIRWARSWPPAKASPQEIHLHLSEVWKSIETAIGESDIIRRERNDPSPWLVDRFEARIQRSQVEPSSAASGLAKRRR